jgi:hypothetical protein
VSDGAERVLYFAYGANVHPGWLRRRIPDAELLGAAELRGYRLAFRKRGRDGAARSDACPGGPGDALPGALYAVRAEALQQLGAAGAGYRMEEVTVMTAVGARRALTWRAEDAALAEGLLPWDWYLQLIRAGAETVGLPEAHQRWLASVACAADESSEQARAAYEVLGARGARATG